MKLNLSGRRQARRDEGAAMVLVLALTAVLAGLGATAAALAANNLNSGRVDRQAGIAQNLSEAGIAQALSWLRYAGAGELRCTPTCDASRDGATDPSGDGPDWGRGPAAGSDYGHLVTMTGGQTYRVWIERLAAKAGDGRATKRFSIHSIGKFQGNAAATGTRVVSQDVTVSPLQFPIGVFGHNVTAGGSGGIYEASVFTDGCITGRKFQTFTGTDSYYGVPAAAHAAGAITLNQNDQCNQGNSIHSGSTRCNSADGGQYVNDTDAYGDTLRPTTDAACIGRGTLNGQPWLTTSKESSFFDMAQMYGFSVTSQGLNNSDLESLRTMATEQGFYFTNTTAIPAALQNPSAHVTLPHPVLFYDLRNMPTSNRLVDLSDLKGYSRAYPVENTSTAACTSYGAIVIVLYGDVRMNANTVLTASVFAPGPAPYGLVNKANGNGQLIGTLYANGIDMRGTSDVILDACYVDNLPGGLLGIKLGKYRENDR